MVDEKGLVNVVLVAPGIKVWEVIGRLVLLLVVQVKGTSLPELLMPIH